VLHLDNTPVLDGQAWPHLALMHHLLLLHLHPLLHLRMHLLLLRRLTWHPLHHHGGASGGW